MQYIINAPAAPVPVEVDMGAMTGTGSAVTLTKYVPGIVSNMRPLYVELSNPAAVLSDLSVTPGAHRLTLSATVNGTTNVTLVMVQTVTSTAYSSDPD